MHSCTYLALQILDCELKVCCITPIIEASSSTARISARRLSMKYVFLPLRSLARSLTACSLKLKRSATSLPVLVLVAISFTTLNRSVTPSYCRDRRFLFGLDGLVGGCITRSIYYSAGDCWWFKRGCGLTSLTIKVPESTSYWLALRLKALLIFDAPLAYSCSYSRPIRWFSVVNWSCILLNVSGSNNSGALSRTESLRTCFKLLSVIMSISTSNIVIRWLMASDTLLTLVQYIGLSKIRRDLDGR